MMGHAFSTPAVTPRCRPRWRRTRRRQWSRPSDLVGIRAMFAAIPSLPRAELSRLTESLINRMDEIDGDTDVEANGDELDGTAGEDDFIHHNANWLGYPGCPVSDPGEDTHDQEREEAHE